MEIAVKKIREGAILPVRGSEEAAGCDLHACLENGKVTLWPNDTVKIPTGIAAAIPDGCFGAIFARSGLAAKQGLRPANCVGVIDSDYRGEIIVALHNDSENDRDIHNGDRIAQLVIMPYVPAKYIELDELDDTARGEGGFGSTGTSTTVAAESEYEQISLFDGQRLFDSQKQ